MSSKAPIYRTPRFKLGQTVKCARFGEVIIGKISDGPIPWPLGRPVASVRGKYTHVVYGDLAKAVRRESQQEVCRLFGVRPSTARHWRRALGVEALTPGTRKLKSQKAVVVYAAHGHAMHEARKQDNAWKEKIATARRGKPRPKHVINAMRKGRKGKPQSPATREKMSQAHKQRGTLPPAAGVPWSEDELLLLQTHTPQAVAVITGRTITAVWNMQRKVKRRSRF